MRSDLPLRANSMRESMRAHLEQDLVPFWRDRAVDAQYGGYLTNFDEEGRSLGTPEKYLNTQARLVWFFSRWARATGDAHARRLAEHGLEFVLGALRDPRHGGFRWKVTADGRPLVDAKIVYGQSFAIYGLAEFARMTGNGPALAAAAETFDLLQKYATDTRHGLYLENFDEAWDPAEPGSGGGDRKTLDTHMHLMESFTNLVLASGTELHQRKLREVVEGIVAHMIDPVTGAGRNHLSRDFRPIPPIAIRHTWNAERGGESVRDPVETTSYGHNTELAWLMRWAIETLDLPSSTYAEARERLVRHAVEHGVDWAHGGVYRDGAPDGTTLVRDKEFWQQAEAMVGFLDAYDAFGDELFFRALENIWRFVRNRMIVHGVGEWRTLLDREGRVLDGQVGNPWKVAYHTGRALLECVERLERFCGSTLGGSDGNDAR